MLDTYSVIKFGWSLLTGGLCSKVVIYKEVKPIRSIQHINSSFHHSSPSFHSTESRRPKISCITDCMFTLLSLKFYSVRMRISILAFIYYTAGEFTGNLHIYRYFKMSQLLRIKITDTEGKFVTVKTIKFDHCTLVRDLVETVHQQAPPGFSGISASDFGLFQPYVTMNNERGDKGRWLAEKNQIRHYGLKNDEPLEFRKKVTPLQVKMMDGTQKSILVDISQNVEVLVRLFCTHIGITTPEEYSFTLEHETNWPKPVEKPGKKPKKDCADNRSVWLKQNNSLRAQGINETEILIFKRKFFCFDFICNSVELHLLFHQLIMLVLSE